MYIGIYRYNFNTYLTNRCANLPDGLSSKMANCHLHLISAGEHWVVDREANSLRRVIRDHKSLAPHLSVIVDDLLATYNDGTNSYYAYIYRYIRIYTGT